MEQSELLRIVVRCFEGIGVPYFVTGSIAAMAYGEPRFTNDIDVVADLKMSQIIALKQAFPEPDFCLETDMVREAINHHSQFNIIHPSSGLKVDVIIPKGDIFDNIRFKRVKRIRPLTDTEANFSSPEDIIIHKMVFYKESESSKHLRDIAGILKISGETLDLDYIRQWTAKLGLQDIWEGILKEVTQK